jgi:hypothetical protein
VDETPQASNSMNELLILLNKQNYTILDLCRVMESLLTGRDERKRALACKLIENCILRLPDIPLAPNGVKVLLEFFFQKLGDIYCVTQAIKSIGGLLLNHKEKMMDGSIPLESIGS